MTYWRLGPTQRKRKRMGISNDQTLPNGIPGPTITTSSAADLLNGGFAPNGHEALLLMIAAAKEEQADLHAQLAEVEKKHAAGVYDDNLYPVLRGDYESALKRVAMLEQFSALTLGMWDALRARLSDDEADEEDIDLATAEEIQEWADENPALARPFSDLILDFVVALNECDWADFF